MDALNDYLTALTSQLIAPKLQSIFINYCHTEPEILTYLESVLSDDQINHADTLIAAARIDLLANPHKYPGYPLSTACAQISDECADPQLEGLSDLSSDSRYMLPNTSYLSSESSFINSSSEIVLGAEVNIQSTNLTGTTGRTHKPAGTPIKKKKMSDEEKREDEARKQLDVENKRAEKRAATQLERDNKAADKAAAEAYARDQAEKEAADNFERLEMEAENRRRREKDGVADVPPTAIEVRMKALEDKMEKLLSTIAANHKEMLGKISEVATTVSGSDAVLKVISQSLKEVIRTDAGTEGPIPPLMLTGRDLPPPPNRERRQATVEDLQGWNVVQL